MTDAVIDPPPPDVFVSVTRLRIRALHHMPRFAIHTMRTRSQLALAAGYLGGALLADRRWTFWTMTMWRSHPDMRAYMTGGAHRKAMPHLLHWCDEASVVHWHQPQVDLPDWSEADRRMRVDGRASKVRHPSADHAAMRFAPPRLSGSVPIPARRS